MILNLTQHVATPEQKAQGVIDVPETLRPMLIRALNFHDLPTREEIEFHVQAILDLIEELEENPVYDIPVVCSCMIGGAPFLMAPLEAALRDKDIRPLYAFSRRECVEETLPDGSVKKTQVFRHLGFVEA